jgi:hypothetical protein
MIYLHMANYHLVFLCQEEANEADRLAVLDKEIHICHHV